MIGSVNDTNTTPKATRRALVAKLVVETDFGPRTVARVLDGAAVRDSTRRAILDAAERCGLTLPAVSP